MNKVVLIGRLTKDPEVKYTQSGKAVARFILAVDRRFSKEQERQADFISCIAWDKLAETIGNYLSKGKKISVEGRIQTGSYEAQDGSRRYTTDIIVNEIEFLEPKQQSEQATGEQFAGQPGIVDDILF